MHKIEIHTHYKIGDKFRLTDKYNPNRSAVYAIRGIRHHQFSPDLEHLMDETLYELINAQAYKLYSEFKSILQISDERLHGIIKEKSTYEDRGYSYTIEKLDQ